MRKETLSTDLEKIPHVSGVFETEKNIFIKINGRQMHEFQVAG